MEASSVRLLITAPHFNGGGVERMASSAAQAMEGLGYVTETRQGRKGMVSALKWQGPWLAATWKSAIPLALRGVSGSVMCHGAELTRDGRPWSALRHQVLRGSQLLAVSPFCFGLVEREVSRKMSLIGPVVGDAWLQSSCRPTRTSDVQLVSVGRFAPRKGHDTAIAAARSLADRKPSLTVELRLVGWGADRARLTRLVIGARSNLRVRFQENSSDDDLRQHFAWADAHLFLPRQERGEFEGLGLVVLEAAACGTPSVVLRCGGNGYSVADGRSGFVIEPGPQATERIGDAAVAAMGLSRDHCRQWASNFSSARFSERLASAFDGRGGLESWPGS